MPDNLAVSERSRVVVIVVVVVRFANSSKLRSSGALPAGHPGHLISFVETDREAYSLSIYSYRGVDGRTRDCRTCAFARVPAIRDADEGEPLQPQTPRPST
ncbi:hypothetical protein Q7P36_000206 [Cladosporium allicinum]